MARARPSIVAAALLALLSVAFAGAESLQLLHVEALGMRADRTRVHVGETFHLAIHVRVAENVSALDELAIPDVGTMQLLGDERHTTHGPAWTDVVETLTLEPTATGRYTFAPAYLDAIDPRDLRPKRFSASRGVTIVVDPAAAPGRDRWALGRSLATALAALVVIVAVALALLGRIRARRERTLVADVTLSLSKGSPAAPPPPLATPRERVAAALRAYRRSHEAPALEKLRSTLFGAAGAMPGATLRDAFASLRHMHGDDPDGVAELRSALVAADRATFGPAHEQEAASRELVDATEAWLRR